MNPRTNRKQRTAIYRAAAKYLEGNAGLEYCCHAFAHVQGTGKTFDWESRVYKRFQNIFGPRKEPRSCGWWGLSITSADERILALCFMAAMVEAGDA